MRRGESFGPPNTSLAKPTNSPAAFRAYGFATVQLTPVMDSARYLCESRVLRFYRRALSESSPGSDQEHQDHRCEKQSCSLQCQLCRRLCASSDHLHALAHDGTAHLCGWVIHGSIISPCSSQDRQDHACGSLCEMLGICQIETAPQSIEATFTGRHETFQYTKVCTALPPWKS